MDRFVKMLKYPFMINLILLAKCLIITRMPFGDLHPTALYLPIQCNPTVQ